jgi:hypothetical protein
MSKDWWFVAGVMAALIAAMTLADWWFAIIGAIGAMKGG